MVARKAWEDYPAPVVDTETGCLRWQGPHDAKGYGRMGRNRDQVHRVAWEREHGPIPEGLTIDHVWERGCRWKDCVLTAHMELVTAVENSSRRKIPRTHCPQKHPYAGDNLVILKDGSRRCRTCRNDQIRAHKARKKEA